MDQLTTSVVRTVSPLVAGSLIAWGVRQGITVDDSVKQPLTEVLALAFSGGYYLAARVLETWVTPAFGWLLGLPRAPAYGPERPPAGPEAGDGSVAGDGPQKPGEAP